MELLVPLVLYAWLPIVLVIFRDVKGHRALAFVYVIAWLFLPIDELPFRHLPDYTKVSATSLAVILAIILFEPHRIFNFRPHWLDALMLVFCFCPIPTALVNSLGIWDGCSNAIKNTLVWGLPYFFGRMYFDRFDKVKTLAQAMFMGGLVYIPFCLIEMRMSPQFYNWVYGPRPVGTMFHSRRWGGWRPMVFLDTGLELGMWMTAASLLGFALWYSGSLKRLWGVGSGLLVGVLFVTTVFCKSTGSLVLLAGGLGTLLAMRWLRSPWPVLCVVLVPLIYIPLRSSGWDDGTSLVQVAESSFGAARARSLGFRFKNEDLLAARAWESPLFGWGGWGREFVDDEYGETQTIVDGMWIVTFGKYGLVGLSAFYAAFLIVPTAACLRFGRPRWRFEDAAPAVAISILLLLYMIDCLLNAMDNALYPLCLGAVTTLWLLPSWKLLESTDLEGAEDEDADHGPSRRLWPPVRARQKKAEAACPPC